jgi:signal transduction histidine kinase
MFGRIGGGADAPIVSAEQVLELAPVAIVGLAAAGRIALVNAQTEALFGHARADLLGQPVELLVPEGLDAAHPRGRHKDGSEFAVEISRRSAGGALEIAAIRDVRGLEAQLSRLQRFESLGQLAGGIAHDFNNHLGVIINYAQFVADEIADDSPALDDVAEIRRAAERAAALTRQLMIFSAREPLGAEQFGLNDAVSDIVGLLRRALGGHVELETRLAPELWPVVADRGQLEQVLVNLAVNARDAMPGGGRLVVETANVELESGRSVRLTVSDTGAGIAAEIAPRVFEPFFTTKPQGSGLGLTAVSGIVSAAGGTVSVDSEPGVGTTITIDLPASGMTRAGDPAAGGRGETCSSWRTSPGSGC